MIIAGASAYPRIIDFERFAAVAKEVGAVLMVDMAHIAGLVATGAHPSPVPLRRLRHLDLAQDAARPALGLRAVQGGVGDRAGQGGLPGPAGRPARAHHRGEGRRVRRGDAARVQDLHRPGRRQRQGDGRGDGRVRPAPRLRRHRQPPHARRPAPRRHHRQGRREPARGASASPSTRTRSRTTRRARSSRAASASARRP